MYTFGGYIGGVRGGLPSIRDACRLFTRPIHCRGRRLTKDRYSIRLIDQKILKYKK